MGAGTRARCSVPIAAQSGPDALGYYKKKSVALWLKAPTRAIGRLLASCSAGGHLPSGSCDRVAACALPGAASTIARRGRPRMMVVFVTGGCGQGCWGPGPQPWHRMNDRTAQSLRVPEQQASLSCLRTGAGRSGVGHAANGRVMANNNYRGAPYARPTPNPQLAISIQAHPDAASCPVCRAYHFCPRLRHRLNSASPKSRRLRPFFFFFSRRSTPSQPSRDPSFTLAPRIYLSAELRPPAARACAHLYCQLSAPKLHRSTKQHHAVAPFRRQRVLEDAPVLVRPPGLAPAPGSVPPCMHPSYPHHCLHCAACQYHLPERH